MLAHLQIGSLRVQATVVLTLLSCFVGCSGNGKVLVPVKGTVMVKGKPAAGASVLFHSESSEELTPSGFVGEDGTFTVMSGLDAGIAPGRYKVCIVWPDPSKKPTKAQIMMGTAEDGPDMLKGKYASKAVTPLSAEIELNTTNLPPFDL